MLGYFKPLGWPVQFTVRGTPRKRAWSLDRSLSRREGERALKARNYPDAERHLIQAVAEMPPGRSSGKRVRLELQLAEAQRKQACSGDPDFDGGKLEQAEATVRAAISEAAQTSDRTGYVMCLDALAEIFSGQENFPAVDTVMEEAIKIEAALPHPDPVRMARRVHRLGIAHYQNGRSEEALQELEKAQALHEQVYGPDHAETARLLSQLGGIYRAQGVHDKAQQCLRRSLRIHERERGAESPEAIKDLHQLAGSLEESGDIESAAGQYERALMLRERVIGGDLDHLAELQFGVAGLYIGWGNFARARELLAESIATFRRKGGPRLAVAHETLAHVHEYSGRHHDAIKELALAAKSWESCGAARGSELAENMEHQADLLQQLGKQDDARWLRERKAELAARAG